MSVSTVEGIFMECPLHGHYVYFPGSSPFAMCPSCWLEANAMKLAVAA